MHPAHTCSLLGLQHAELRPAALGCCWPTAQHLMPAEHTGVQCSITALSLQPRTHSTVPAAMDANTCTAQPPNTPNNASAVGSMLLFSTSSSMTNPQRANGYAQVYTQVSFEDGLGIGCLSECGGRHKAMILKRCTAIILAVGSGWTKSRCGASQLRRPPLFQSSASLRTAAVVHCRPASVSQPHGRTHTLHRLCCPCADGKLEAAQQAACSPSIVPAPGTAPAVCIQLSACTLTC